MGSELTKEVVSLETIELEVMDDDSLDVMTVEDAMGSLAIDEDVSVNEELIGLDEKLDEGVLETTLDST
jgi:hypothetical protein